MSEGYVYVLVNPSMPGMVKIGKTTRLPADRVAELSAATGVATPFLIAFEQFFEDCDGAEAAVHAELERRGLRVASRREFFRAVPSECIRVIVDFGAEAETQSPAPRRRPARAPAAASLLRAGDQALYGLGHTLQDRATAIRLFRQAASAGALLAYERLGAVFARQNPLPAGDRQRAIDILRQGTQRGNYYCYCELGSLYAASGHHANFEKSWGLFFASHLHGEKLDLVPGKDRFPIACQQYLETCHEYGWPVYHVSQLATQADAMVASLLARMDRVRDNPTAHGHVLRTLRWLNDTLIVPRRRAEEGRPEALRPAAPPLDPAKKHALWNLFARVGGEGRRSRGQLAPPLLLPLQEGSKALNSLARSRAKARGVLSSLGTAVGDG